jgi:endonuclease/exonuclease/phosphatase family metal-dependent hydrolase
MHQDSLTRRFYFQRAILETRMISQQGRSLALLNTHFDAWGDGSDLMPAQVGVAMNLFQRLEREQIPWIIGGDFNLLPPDEGRQWHKLEAAGTADFDRETALAPLYEQFGAIPSRQHLIGEKPHLWYTHFPNDPRVEGPDRTIDYLFYSHHWQLQKGYVRQHDTLDVSDHLPVVGQWRLQEPKTASLH